MSAILNSIVIPVYNEETVLPALIARVTAMVKENHLNSEIIFVNDGSSDGSLSILQKASSENEIVSVINLSRNFGHQQAVSAGLKYSSGEIVVILDGDLQDPPELVPEILKKLSSGYDVVYAVRKSRQEGYFLTSMYKIFYRLLKLISNIDIPLDSGDFAGLSRRVVDEINNMGEYNRFVRGLRSYVGFKQTKIEYDRAPRAGGDSKYSPGKLIRLAMDGLFGFSQYPLRIASVLGSIVALISLGYAVYWFFWRIFTDQQIPGFATLAVAIFFLGGIQLLCVGVLGEYIGRIYDEVKRRPPYIVDNVIGPAGSVQSEVSKN